MSSTFPSNAERLAKNAENYPSIFGKVNLTSIRENVGEILKLVGRDGIFREYTLHDANHIDSMLLLVDKLIPVDTAAKMKTADWLIIVLSCYFHDLGMLVTKKEFENRYNGSDFPAFKEKLFVGDKGKDYEEALGKEGVEDREEFLYQEFVREHHAQRIAHWIQGQDAPQYGDAKAAVEAVNDLLFGLDHVVRNDLAKICLSHHQDDLFNFDKYQVNRVYGDDPECEANLHYAALILRTADILQIQKKRVPTVLYKIIDPSNPKSQAEWVKQAGVRAIKPKIQPNGEATDVIEVHASFDQESAYFGLLAYLQQYAGKELERCYDWAKQARKKGSTYLYPWKQIDSSQVEPQGFEGRSYAFRLDQEKILNLLTGHTLYNDSRVAIREVLQNALDAVRFRKFLFPEEPLGKIEVIWDSKSRRLTIRDTGTGMTQDTIENFLLNVGSSFYQSETVVQKYTGFSAISRFGIGVLSTFMIADEVQILTVHPDDEFARKLTLPSVVKSYLIKKTTKGDSELKNIGSHGTEVILQIRRSAELSDVEAFVRYWMVLPECEITCKTDDSDPVTIGFPNAQAVISHYFEQGKKQHTKYLSYEVRKESIPGIELSYMVSKSIFSDVWDFARMSELEEISIQELENENDFLSSPPGMCVEGVRVRSVPAGYDRQEDAPWVFANLTGPNSPKTNVARSDIEQNPEHERILFQIYSLIGKHIQNEFARILKKKTGIVEAAGEADFIRYYGLEQSKLTDKSKFDEAMSMLKVIALEEDDACCAVSKKDLMSFAKVWTVDSRLVRNIESISGALGIDLPTKKIVEILGKVIDPVMPLPRILGISKNPIQDRYISKIRIYPEERTHRIDICWDNTKSDKWITVPRSLAESHHYDVEDTRLLITRDEELSLDCPDYDFIIWREWKLILPSSGVPKLLDAFGMNERFGRWLDILVRNGVIPVDQRPVLREHLAMANYTDADTLINNLALPFERRFGDSRGTTRYL